MRWTPRTPTQHAAFLMKSTPPSLCLAATEGSYLTLRARSFLAIRSGCRSNVILSSSVQVYRYQIRLRLRYLSEMRRSWHYRE